MSRRKEIREERARLETRAEEIVKAIDPEKGITAEAKTELEKIHTRSMTLKGEDDALEQFEAIRGGNDQHQELPPSNVRSAGLDHREEVTEDTRALAFQGMLRSECRMTLEKRHEEAIQRCRIPMERGELILRTARTDQFRTAQEAIRHRRALDLTTAEPVVPVGFMNRLESVMLTVGPLLQFIDIVRTDDGNEFKWPLEDDSSEEAVIVDELGSTAAEAQPTLSKITLGAYKYFAKRIPVSTELLTDSPINLVDFFATTIGRRLSKGMVRDFTLGDNVDKPHGINVAAEVGLTAAAVDALTSDEIITMTHSIDESHRAAARWMMHDLITLEVRLLKDAHTGNYLWRAGLEQGEPDRLAGYPLFRNSYMPSVMAANAKVAAFGDFSKYKGRQVNGVRLKREYVLDTDSEVFTGFMRADGDLINPAALKTLQMAAA